MKKVLFILAVVFTMGLFHSCSLFKSKKSSDVISDLKQQNNVQVSKERTDSVSNVKFGISENTSKIFSEEVTVKNNVLLPTELTARFKVDTARSLNGDTALTLVDINDSNISVVIYQNRKTNELTAKVTTKGGVKNIPFSEMQIKRNYSETTSKIDTTKIITSVSSSKVDSLNKNKTDNYNSKVENDWQLRNWVISGILLVFFGTILYFVLRPRK